MNVIVSVTTTQARLHLFFYAFQSLKRQTFEDFSIVVSLSKDPYLFDQGIDSVPDWMTGGNVEVNFVRNIGPYRKLLPRIMSIGEDDLLVTADDDILYSEDWLKSLVRRAGENPGAIVCCRARVIRKNFLGRFQSYANWDLCAKSGSSMDLLPTGCGGVVFRKSLLDLEFLSDKAYLEYAKTADDVWFKIASLRKNTPVYVDPEIDKKSGYIRHSLGLEKVNLYQSKRANRLHKRVMRKLIEKSRHYFGISSCENDMAWKRSLEYSRQKDSATMNSR